MEKGILTPRRVYYWLQGNELAELRLIRLFLSGIRCILSLGSQMKRCIATAFDFYSATIKLDAVSLCVHV